MALITCNECGQMVSDKASACPHCGNPISTNYVAEDLPQQNQQTQNSSSGTPRWIVPVLIAALVVLAGAISYILLNKSQSKEVEKQSAVAETVDSVVSTHIEHTRPAVPTVKRRDPSMLTRYCIMTRNYGYVNVRRQRTTNSGVVKRLYDGEAFYGYLPSGSNWIEYVENGIVKGYVRQDVVRKPGQSGYFYEDEYYY